jgi:hypothetical protein
MLVTVTVGEDIYTMGYDPCHYEGVRDYYHEALLNGEIESYAIEL